MSKRIIITRMDFLNFKGIRDLTVDFDSDLTSIYADNGLGKTSIFDGFTWVLFGKDSKDRKSFGIKTYDESGKTIPRIPHEVTVTLLVNGEEVTLCRRYNEKWTKKRGSAEEVFDGHEEERLYNGVPCSVKEYNDKIAAICSEDVFKFITNPLHFTKQKAEVQRQMLIQMAGGVSDTEIAQGNADFENLLSKLTGKNLEEYKRDIQEIGQEMVAVINEMVEDIIGGSAADIAEQLGDAFFDAFRDGEDAAKAWKETVDDIVSDIVKRMLVTELLEKPIGQLFDRYKTKWFGDDGTFKGIDAINNSMGAFANELYGLVNIFSEGMEGLPDELKDIILGDAETTREGTQKGIATASQESVDENNARLTTIQGHTYSIMTGVVELNRIGNLVLERLMGIENNTAETNTRLDNLDKRVSKVSSTLNDIQLKGLKIQR